MGDVDIEILRRELEEELVLMTPKEKGEEREQVWDKVMRLTLIIIIIIIINLLLLSATSELIVLNF